MFKVNNKDARKTSLMLFSVFMVNFKYILYLFIVFILLTLNRCVFVGL